MNRIGNRLSSWLPRSSFGRVALSVGLVLIAGQLVTAILIRIYVAIPYAQQSGTVLAGQLLFARSLLVQGIEPGATPLLSTGGYHFSESPPSGKVPWPQLHYYQVLRQALQAQLGADAPVLLVRESSGFGLSVWTSSRDRGPWVGVTLVQPETLLGYPIMIWVTLMVLVSLGIAALTVRYLDRPLRRLADAAQRFGRGETPSPLPPAGSDEVRELTHRFNQMMSERVAQERQRRLFLAGISHDLRTPLTRLRLALEMMTDKDPLLHAEAGRNIDDLEAIIAQFLNDLRGEAQEQPQSLDLNQLVSAVAAPYQRRGMALSLSLDDSALLRSLSLRPRAWSRLLTNLLDNAERYAGQGGVVLQTRVVDHGEQQLSLRVLDRGPGIPDQTLASALQPYRRLRAGDGVDPDGVGLGLSIVARIAAIEGWTLTLSNRSAGGLAVELRYPDKST